MRYATARTTDGPRSGARTCGRGYSLESIHWLDVSAGFCLWIWTFVKTLHLRAHDVYAGKHRYLFHRQRIQNRRSSFDCGTEKDNSSKEKGRDGSRNSLWWNPFGGGDNGEDQDLIGNGLWTLPLKQSWKMKSRKRNGQALLEFAILIPLLIILIGATVSIGLFFYQANVLQQAVDVAAQEISRTAFPVNHQLGLGRIQNCDADDLVSLDSDFKAQIYDEQYLVIHDSEWAEGTTFNGDFQEFVDSLPLLNRLLVQVMVRDNEMTRYPGTIVQNGAGEETVLIPIVEYRASAAGNSNPDSVPSTISTAGETICEWVAPVEEIMVDHDGDSNTPNVGPYALNSDQSATLSSFQAGMVALRINYPAQSTTLINRTTQSNGGGESSQVGGNVIVIANDTQLKSGATTGCYSIVSPSARVSQASGQPGSNPQAGLYGLGEIEALTRVVRPYRKVISVQAIYRREVFSYDSP